MGHSYRHPIRKVVEPVHRARSNRKTCSLDICRVACRPLHWHTLHMSYLTEAAQLIWENLPTDAQPPTDADDLFLLYAVLLRSKGEQVTAADVHDAWAAWMELRNPGHAAIVP